MGWGLNFPPFICFQYLLLAVELFSIYFQYYLRACFNLLILSIDFLLLVFRDGYDICVQSTKDGCIFL